MAVPLEMTATSLTIGSGGSAGPEAPVVMSGAAIGSNIAQAFSNREGSHQRADESDKRQDRRKLQHAFAREQIEDRHAETGTGIDAQETRVGQVVVAQGLQDDTGTCQAGAGHRQHQSPGQADLVKDVVFFKNPVP